MDIVTKLLDKGANVNQLTNVRCSLISYVQSSHEYMYVTGKVEQSAVDSSGGSCRGGQVAAGERSRPHNT